MVERLQQIFQLRQLQEETIAYRDSMRLYQTLMKQSCEAEIKNLINVEMNIAQTQLRIPDPKRVPPISEPMIDSTELSTVLMDVKTAKEAYDLL